jgi:hypothetical protein
MELPILLLTPLPESAVKLVTQFLRKPHPCAVLIKQLTFYYEGCLRKELGRVANFLCVDADDCTYRFCYIIQSGELASEWTQRARYPRSDDDDDHVDCPGCSNCLGY